jgi:flagellar protein FlaG
MIDVQAMNPLPADLSRVTQQARPETQQARVPSVPGAPDEGGGAAHLAATAASTPARGREETREDPVAAFQKALEESVEELNAFVHPYNTNLFFSIEHEIDKVIVQVKDRETEEVIKQIPSEEAVALAKALDKLKGLLVHQEA